MRLLRLGFVTFFLAPSGAALAASDDEPPPAHLTPKQERQGSAERYARREQLAGKLTLVGAATLAVAGALSMGISSVYMVPAPEACNGRCMRGDYNANNAFVAGMVMLPVSVFVALSGAMWMAIGHYHHKAADRLVADLRHFELRF